VLISLISAKGSPGVTTTTLAVASRWSRPAVVVDADPLSGDMLAGVGAGRIPAAANLMELMVAARTVGMADALADQLVRPGGEHCPPFVPGLGAPGQAAGLAWEKLAAGLTSVPWADVLADCGRYGTAPTPLPMLRHSELVVLLVGSCLRSVRAAQRSVPVIRTELTRAGGVADHLVAVVVDPGQPYGQSEIAEALELPVIAWLPHDPPTAAVWSDGADPGRGFARSPLQRATAHLAAQLMSLATQRQAWLDGSRRPRTPPDVPAQAGLVGLVPGGEWPVIPAPTTPANGMRRSRSEGGS